MAPSHLGEGWGEGPHIMNNIPCIALVGNAPAEKCELLNTLLDEEGLSEMYDVALYGADGQPEMSALSDALRDYEDGAVDGVVCLPMKKAIENVMPIRISSTSRLAAVKRQTSMAEAANSLTKEEIAECVTKLWKTLKRDLAIQNPRIAITSLNNEISTAEDSAEMNVIAPAVSELVKQGIQIFGPIAANKMFEGDGFMAFDLVVEIYEGQCDEAFIKATNEETVTLLSGIETPMTQTEAEGLYTAINLVMDVEKNRKDYDEANANPLQKLYHEKKEDGDKARFAVKKKGFNPAEHRRENVTYIKATDQNTPPTEEKTVKE